MNLPDIDKQGHIWAGAAICLGFAVIIGNITSGLLIAIGAGIIREATGNRDMGDFLATVLGALFSVLVWWGTK